MLSRAVRIWCCTFVFSLEHDNLRVHIKQLQKCISNKNTLVSHVLPVVILLVFPRYSSLLKEVFVVKQSEKEVSSLQQKEQCKKL